MKQQTIPFTRIPNRILDEHIKHLKACELKVLLVVLRQTVGFHKRRDWLSRSQMEKKTGLSRRSISEALNGLISRGLLQVTDESGRPLDKAVDRKGKTRLYYTPGLGRRAETAQASAESIHTPAHYLRTTKEISTRRML